MQKVEETISVMTHQIKYLIALVIVLCTFTEEGFAQCTGWGGYTPTTDAIECGGGFPQPPCCQVYNACNGPLSGCNTYEPYAPYVNGCDMTCTPIDSGVLFLLLGGAAFGGAMIVRNRRREFQLKSERV